MKVLFFGRLAEQVGREVEHEVPAEGCTVAALRQGLAATHPRIAGAIDKSAARACIDQQLADEEAQVRPGQEVAFLPPLSGG